MTIAEVGDTCVKTIDDKPAFDVYETYSEQEINDIFRPFKKTSVRPTSGESSHGLGLAIVKKIIEGHKGEVGVSSVVGTGSNFYFTLPI